MTIWTIDFDIIMAPSIEVYNDLVGDSKDIQSIIRDNPGLEYCLPGDLALYDGATRVLMKQIKTLKAEDVYFIRDHQDICKIVKDWDEFDIVNVDHHHDTGYGAGATIASKVRRPESGNWVKYLKEQGKLKKYTWIHDAKAVAPTKYMAKAFIDEDIDLEIFQGPVTADKLVICMSRQWIPHHYLHLYYAWMGICEEYFGKNFDFVEVDDDSYVRRELVRL